jgi:hypothetical protein
MNPNLYPDMGPAPANVVLDPPMGPEPAPNLYRPLSERDGIDHINQVDTLVVGLQDVYSEWNSHQEAVNGNLYGSPQEQQAEDQRIRQDRQRIEQGIAQLYATSDSSAILDRLRGHFDHRDRYEAGVPAAAAAAQTLSTDRRYDALDANNVLTTTNLHNVHSTGASYEVAVAELAASRANIAQRNMGQGINQDRNFNNRLGLIHQTLEQRHDAAVNQIQDQVDDLTRDLRLWDFQQAPAPGQEDQIRARLDALSQDLNDHGNLLGRHDSARARLFSDWARLRYRAEARNINFRDPADTRPGPVYTADGGIVINVGNPTDERIIFANGDIQRPGDVRRNAGGCEVAAPDLLVLDPNHPAPTDPVNVVVARWEERRTPEAAQDAHAALSGQIEMWQEQDNQHANRLTELRQDRVEAANEVARLQALPAPTTPEEITARTDAIDAAQNRVRTAIRDIPILEGNIRRLRAQLNPAEYTRSLIEAGARPPQTPQQSRWARLGRRAGNIQSDVPSPPEMEQDGSIVRDNWMVNGRRGAWRMYPDGRAGRVVRYTNGALGTEYYQPNGNDRHGNVI